MGKRSNFQRRERDFYPTPPEAVIPLLPHLAEQSRFIEPCAGDGRLSMYLVAAGHKLIEQSDVEPQSPIVNRADALTAKWNDAELFITNPPWDRKVLHPLIENLSDQAPTWLLFDADWVHTRQSIPFLPRLRKIISIGRIKWIPDSKMTGKDNCAWHLFDQPSNTSTIQFIGRYG